LKNLDHSFKGSSAHGDIKKGEGKGGIEALLNEELGRLEARLGLNRGYRVLWMPGIEKGISGEVRGNTIFIYEADRDKALGTLRHELIDHLITSRLVKPLVDLINILVKAKGRKYTGRRRGS